MRRSVLPYVDPARYGHDRHPLTKTFRPEQDEFEIELVRRALDRGMPVLGICRGIQVLAVADGGSLVQDVETIHPNAPRHRQPWVDLALAPPGDHWHDVEVAAGSGAERWFDGGPARVNSFHHQCVSDPGSRLRATVHWHNELMWRGDERFLRPFEDLVAAARAHAEVGRAGAASPGTSQRISAS